MRRFVLLLSVTAAVLVVGGGVALAAVEFGTNGPNEIFGTRDSDVLYGRGGSDLLEGGPGGGDDRLYGEGGNDSIFDLGGDDFLHGGAGDDFMADQRGENVFYGGSGVDFIASTAINPDRPNSVRLPREKDVIFCGSGRDTVEVDPGRVDIVASDCERVEVATVR